MNIDIKKIIENITESKNTYFQNSKKNQYSLDFEKGFKEGIDIAIESFSVELTKFLKKDKQQLENGIEEEKIDRLEKVQKVIDFLKTKK